MIRFSIVTVSVAIALAVVPQSASAQPEAITIREGSVVWGSDFPIIDLKGTKSFRVTGISVPQFGTVHSEFLSCPGVCLPGDTVPFGLGESSGHDFRADVTFRGAFLRQVNDMYADECAAGDICNRSVRGHG